MAQLGTVMRRFPDGVMVYRLWREKNLLSAVKVTRDDAYDLVLVFDSSGVLRTHRLLQVR